MSDKTINVQGETLNTEYSFVEMSMLMGVLGMLFTLLYFQNPTLAFVLAIMLFVIVVYITFFKEQFIDLF